jgi:hypothetical protein
MRRTLTEVGASDVLAWRAGGAVLLGLGTGLLAAWLWALVEIYRAFF